MATNATWRDWFKAQSDGSTMETRVIDAAYAMLQSRDLSTLLKPVLGPDKQPTGNLAGGGWSILRSGACNLKFTCQANKPWVLTEVPAMVPAQLSSSADLASAPVLYIMGGDLCFRATRPIGSTAKVEEIFFRVPGLRVWGGGREVEGWNQLGIIEASKGALILPYDPRTQRFLLAAKAEPGNASNGHILLTTPLQASESNLKQAHGGTTPPGMEYLAHIDTWTDLLSDGGRFIGKVNKHSVYEVDETKITPKPNERWFSIRELFEAYTDGALGEHLLKAAFPLLAELGMNMSALIQAHHAGVLTAEALTALLNAYPAPTT